MALQVGDKAIWRPWSRFDEKHPWYGHTVTIRQTPTSPYAPLYQFSVDDAPAWVLSLLERAVKADTEKESGKE